MVSLSDVSFVLNNSCSDAWLTNRFDIISKEQRIAVFVGATGVAYASFLLLKTIYAAIHGQPKSMQPTRHSIKSKMV